MEYEDININKESLEEKKHWFIPGFILFIVGFYLFVIEEPIELFSIGVITLTVSGAFLLTASIAIIWAASNVGNTKLKQSKHLVIAVIVGIFSFIVYHIPGIIGKYQ